MHLLKQAVVPHPIRQSQKASDVGSLETATHAGSQAARKHASQAGDSDSMVHSPPPAMPAAPALPAIPALPALPAIPALPAEPIPALPASAPAAPGPPENPAGPPASAPPVPAVPACPEEPDAPPRPAEPPGSAGSEPAHATRHSPTQPSNRRRVFMGVAHEHAACQTRMAQEQGNVSDRLRTRGSQVGTGRSRRGVGSRRTATSPGEWETRTQRRTPSYAGRARRRTPGPAASARLLPRPSPHPTTSRNVRFRPGNSGDA